MLSVLAVLFTSNRVNYHHSHQPCMPIDIVKQPQVHVNIKLLPYL